MKESDIQNFYKNKNVFITGGTGFLGIAIVEKILRSCPEVSCFFIDQIAFSFLVFLW